MLTYRLVHLIEYHSNTLAGNLLRKVQSSERTVSYANSVPPEELKLHVREIYEHIGSWLLDKSEADIEQRYTAIGSRRAEQKVPLHELAWAIILTKQTLWEFIDDVSFSTRIVEVADKQELQRLIDQFFDSAIYAATVGYQWAAEEGAGPERGMRKAG